MFKPGDVVGYRGPFKPNFGKQYTIEEVYPSDESSYEPYCHVLEDVSFAPHLKNLIHVNFSLENE